VRAIEHGQDCGKLGAYGRQVLSIAFQGGYQALFGLGQQRPTQIYTHVLNRGPSAVKSPIDTIFGP